MSTPDKGLRILRIDARLFLDSLKGRVRLTSSETYLPDDTSVVFSDHSLQHPRSLFLVLESASWDPTPDGDEIPFLDPQAVQVTVVEMPTLSVTSPGKSGFRAGDPVRILENGCEGKVLGTIKYLNKILVLCLWTDTNGKSQESYFPVDQLRILVRDIYVPPMPIE